MSQKTFILITGAAGFIGYHLCKFLLSKGFSIIGVDNLNSYYGALKWDGRDMLGNHVANGVYFIRINYASSSNQSPGDNWTKLIVVK